MNLRPALLRYRVLAYATGVLLFILVFVAVPLRYLAAEPTLSHLVGPVHGFVYVGYLLVTLDLTRRAGWTWRRWLWVSLAGTVPLMSFVAERRISRLLEPADRSR